MNKDGNNYTIKNSKNSAEENITYNSLPYTDNDNILHTDNHLPYIARKTLNLLTVNCCSLRNSTKRLQLAALIKEHDIDIVMGRESHLDASYFTSEVFPTNYVVYHKDRSIGGGGVFVAIKDDLTLSHEPILSTSAELV